MEKAYKEFVSKVFDSEADVEVIVANSIWAKEYVPLIFNEYRYAYLAD